eukprot:5734442-Heterocapsa_arctica.AAC.1
MGAMMRGRAGCCTRTLAMGSSTYVESRTRSDRVAYGCVNRDCISRAASPTTAAHVTCAPLEPCAARVKT